MARAAALACSLLVLAAGGCGADDDDGSAETQPSEAPSETVRAEPEERRTGPESAPGLTRPEPGGFAARADRLCEDAQDDLRSTAERFRDARQALSSEEITSEEYDRRAAALIARIAAITRRTASSIEALEPPDAKRDALDAYLAGARVQVRLLKRQADAQRAGDDRAMAEAAAQLGRAFQEMDDAAQELGFETCGRVSPQAQP